MRIFLLAGIAGLVCLAVLAAAALMNETFGQGGNSNLTVNNSKTGSQASSAAQTSGTLSSEESGLQSKEESKSGTLGESTTSAGSKPSVSSKQDTSSQGKGETTSNAPQLIQNTVRDGYDYTKPVAESKAVSRSFFDDAVILGDSRTVGMINFVGLSNAKSYARVSCSAKMILEDEIITNSAGKKVTILQSIQETKNKYQKAYIMLGLNEIGYPNYATLMNRYREIIDGIKQSQPNADIYLQAVLPITKTANQKHSYLRMDKIKQFNAQLKKLAQQEKVFYVDPSSVFLGEDGFMVDEASASAKDMGVHFNKTYCQKWYDYLLTHTVR